MAQKVADTPDTYGRKLYPERKKYPDMSFLTIRGFPFDFLFLSDWMECSFDLLSIKVKLKYPVTASPTCPFMIIGR